MWLAYQRLVLTSHCPSDRIKRPVAVDACAVNYRSGIERGRWAPGLSRHISPGVEMHFQGRADQTFSERQAIRRRQHALSVAGRQHAWAFAPLCMCVCVSLWVRRVFQDSWHCARTGGDELNRFSLASGADFSEEPRFIALVRRSWHYFYFSVLFQKSSPPPDSWTECPVLLSALPSILFRLSLPFFFMRVCARNFHYNSSNRPWTSFIFIRMT